MRSSAGFWPGNGGYGRAAFYAYAAPTPDGLQNTVLKAKGGFNQKMGEFLLDYNDARDCEDPADTVVQFLEEIYSAAAYLAKWDRHRSIGRTRSPARCGLSAPRQCRHVRDE